MKTVKCKNCSKLVIKSVSHQQDYCSLDCRIKPFLKKNGECLEWTMGTAKSGGHGRVAWCGTNYRVHRYVYESYHNIKLTTEQQVMHSCDNPVCCNIDHLSIGTFEDNMNDKLSKGRQSKGVQNNHKLTEQEVKEIFLSNEKCSKLAEKYNVIPGTIRNIKIGERWKHITSSLVPTYQPKRNLDKETIIKIYQDTDTSSNIMKKYNISRSSLCRIKNKQSYKDILENL